MEFNFIKTIVSALVFGFFLFIIVNHILNTWFSGALHESDRNNFEGFADVSNSEMISDLFDRVNLLLDKMRTLKTPYTDTVTTVSYNRDLSGNMVILSNLKTLVTMGVDVINTDLQKNPGILEVYPSYSGNDSIKQIILDLGSLDDKKLDEDCSKKDMTSCDIIASATDKAICVANIKTQCVKEIETSFLKRVISIVDEHQRTIDKILKK